MATPASSKLNKLLDDVESGSISVLDFLKDVSGKPEYLDGLGKHVTKSGKPSRVRLKGAFARSRVLMRIEAVDPTGANHVEGSVLPGALQFTQLMKRGQFETLVTKGAAEINVAGTTSKVSTGNKLVIHAGKPFGFMNSGSQPWDFKAIHSAWNPDTFVYEYAQQMLVGDQLWFSIKPTMDDASDRPYYNIRSSTAGTFSVVMVDPKQSTIPCYYSDGENIISGLVGTGELVLGTKRIPLERGKAQSVPPKEPFQIVNPGPEPLMAEIRPEPAREWQPGTSFWESQPGKFVTGDQVFFEYVFSTP